MTNISMRRGVAVAGTLAVTAVALSITGYGSAGAVTLPGGLTTQALADGTTVSVKLTEESVVIARSGAANATTRNAWASGKVLVTVDGASRTTVTAGYLVGCQVDLSGGSAGSGGSLAAKKGTLANSDSKVTSNGSVTLTPGVAKFIPVLDSGVGKYNGAAKVNTNFSFKGNRGGIAYSEETFQVNGCAGYASAKAAISVKVSTDTVDGYVTLYGKPFSLG